MRLYLAGLFTNGFGNSRYSSRLTEAEEADRSGVENYLESYHYIGKEKYVNDIRREKRQVFLDSGAFSSFTKGVEVDLPAYCDYIKRNIDIVESVGGAVCASVLDSIGSAQGTWENQVKMEQHGVRPLPCFHYGEDERYLEYYVANYSYITIGGMVPISSPQLKLWLDRIWEKYLTNEDGSPKLRVHGFGLTTISLMERYPWYSVDSSSWVQIAANGGILFRDNWKALSVSSNSPSRKMKNQHMLTLSDPHQEAVKASLVRDGYDPERLSTEYLARWAFNCGSFTRLGDLMDRIGVKEFSEEQPLLF